MAFREKGHHHLASGGTPVWHVEGPAFNPQHLHLKALMRKTGTCSVLPPGDSGEPLWCSSWDTGVSDQDWQDPSSVRPGLRLLAMKALWVSLDQ